MPHRIALPGFQREPVALGYPTQVLGVTRIYYSFFGYIIVRFVGHSAGSHPIVVFRVSFRGGDREWTLFVGPLIDRSCKLGIWFMCFMGDSDAGQGHTSGELQ